MYSSKTFNTKNVSPDNEPVWPPKTWPPQSTFRNPKTGLVIKQDNHIMRSVGNEKTRDRVLLLEYPAGSGNLWNRKYEAVGRWDATKPEGQRYLKDAPHVEWNPPETNDQVLAREMASKDVEIAALKKELAAIQSEREAVKKPAVKKDSGA